GDQSPAHFVCRLRHRATSFGRFVSSSSLPRRSLPTHQVAKCCFIVVLRKPFEQFSVMGLCRRIDPFFHFLITHFGSSRPCNRGRPGPRTRSRMISASESSNTMR